MKKILFIATLLFIINSPFTSFAQPEKYLKNRIMVEGFYTRNLGNFGDVWKSAAGGYVGYGIAFPDHNLLMIRTGFISNTLRDNIAYNDASSSVVPLEIGGRYYFSDDTFMPFFQFMNGFNVIFENISLEGTKEDKTYFRYAWQVGFGATFNISNNLNFDIGINYQSNFYHPEAMNTGFEYAAGLGWGMN